MYDVMNREAWLTTLARTIEEAVFADFRLAPYRLTCGWPSKSALSSKGRRVGECHSLAASTGGVHEIFVSPVLDSSVEVAGVVCHELAHVAAGVAAAHGKDFIRVCHHVGLTAGRPRNIMPGERLRWLLTRILEGVPAYPHRAMVAARRDAGARQPARSVKLECELCSCLAAMPRDWFDCVGAPICRCGGKFFIREGKRVAAFSDS